MRKIGTVLNVLFVATALVAALSLVACESDSGGTTPGTDTNGGYGQDTVQPGNDTVNPGTDVPGGDVPPCTPECGTRQCGLDPTCRTSCGTCEAGEVCTPEGMCCMPNCAGKQCGNDGCGGTCAPGCPAGVTCLANGTCDCSCGAAECGTDACGNPCGTCDAGNICQSGRCVPDGAPSGSCCDWFTCVNNDCPPTSDMRECFLMCDERLSEAGLAAKNALESCRAERCGHCQDEECYSTCSDELCGAEYEACMVTCFKGTGNCYSLIGCLNNCPETDEFCADRCFEETSYEGYMQFQEIIDCLVANCPNGDLANCDQQTVLGEGGACQAVWDACTTVPPCTGATCYDCNGLIRCLNGCAETDANCPSQCFMNATAEAQTQFDGIIDCLVANCPGGDLETCDQQTVLGEGGACESVWTACVGTVEFCDPATATNCLECGDFVGCLNGCGDTDQACVNACLDAVTEDGYNGFTAIIECLEANCPGGDLQGCDQNALLNTGGACAAVWTSCVGEGPAACEGADCLNCAGILECMNGCGETDEACVDACFEQGTAAAQSQLTTMYQCLYAQCPPATTPNFETCANTALTGACSAQAMACEGLAGKSANRGVVKVRKAVVQAKAAPIMTIQKQVKKSWTFTKTSKKLAVQTPACTK